MLFAVVGQVDMGRRKRRIEPPQHFGCNGSGSGVVHAAYIGRLIERESEWLPVTPDFTAGSRARGTAAQFQGATSQASSRRRCSRPVSTVPVLGASCAW